MKRTFITIYAMMLAIPTVVALIDAAALVVLGDTLIHQEWRQVRALIAVVLGGLGALLGGLTWSVLSDWKRRQE